VAVMETGASHLLSKLEVEPRGCCARELLQGCAFQGGASTGPERRRLCLLEGTEEELAAPDDEPPCACDIPIPVGIVQEAARSSMLQENEEEGPDSWQTLRESDVVADPAWPPQLENPELLVSPEFGHAVSGNKKHTQTKEGLRVSGAAGSTEEKSSTRHNPDAAAVRTSAAQIGVLEDTRLQAEACLTRLQHARYARWADHMICERRLEFLQQWPARSISEARLQEAVDGEQGMLIQARQQLLDLEHEVREMLGLLDAVRGKLRRELPRQRSAVRSQQLRLARSRSSGQALPRRSVQADADVRPAVRHAQELQRSSSKLCDRVDAAIDGTSSSCREAAALTRACLAECASEQGDLRRRLEGQLGELDHAIAEAEWFAESCGKGMRVPVEARAPPYAKASLHELRGKRRGLQDALRQTASLLQVVDACRRVTASDSFAARGTTRQRPGSSHRGCSAAQRPCSAQPRYRSEDEAPGLMRALTTVLADRHGLSKGLQDCRRGLARCASWAAAVDSLEQEALEVLSHGAVPGDWLQD